MGGWAAFLLFFLRANYAHIFALRTISAALSLRSVRRRGACLCPTIRARSFAALVFSNSRPQNRSAARGLLPPRKGASGCAVFAAAVVGKAVSKKRCDPFFLTPQGNIIISNRKFVMMFQKKRALSAALSLRSVRRRGACLRKIYSAAGFCRACFIITARKPGRGAGAFAALFF